MTPADPATYIGVALLISTVVIAGTIIPLRRATGSDPVAALRSE